MEKEGGCSFTSASLEPRWLARIQPHSGFDEAWILKLNQSHMSPTERVRGRQTGLKDRERDGGGGRYKGTKGGRDRRQERRKETGNGRWYRTKGKRKVIKRPGYTHKDLQTKKWDFSL